VNRRLAIPLVSLVATLLPAPAHADDAPDAPKAAAPDKEKDKDTALERAASRAAGEPSAREFGLAVANVHGRYAIANRPDKIGDARHIGTLAFSTRMIYGDLVGYAFGVGFEAGGTYQAGLAYGLDVMPVGGALALGRRGFLMLGGGAGLSGVAVDPIPFAVRFPLELRLEVEPVEGLRVMTGAEVAWTPFTSARREGAPRASFADEIRWVFLLGTSANEQHGSYSAWRGYFMGLDYREIMGTPILGLVLGTNLGSAQ